MESSNQNEFGDNNHPNNELKNKSIDELASFSPADGRTTSEDFHAADEPSSNKQLSSSYYDGEANSGNTVPPSIDIALGEGDQAVPIDSHEVQSDSEKPLPQPPLHETVQNPQYDNLIGEKLYNNPSYDEIEELEAQDDLHIECAAMAFAMEHRIFLRAILELFAQRDQNATKVGMHDPNILKSGPLKKASHLMRGIWKVKFVEIRRGMFSYYEDAKSGKDGSRNGELLRKNVPLEANSCRCRPVKLHQKALNITPGGAIFELAVDGGFKRLWMANSREERQKWILAVHNAMVGGSVTRGGSTTDNRMHGKSGGVNSRSPYKNDLKKYLKIQSAVKNAKSKEEYVNAIRTLLNQPLNVPVKWIIEQVGEVSSRAGKPTGAFHEGGINTSVEQLWKDLVRDSVKINDELLIGDSGNAPERMMGCLARTIMSIARSDNNSGNTSVRKKFDINESQALAYSRDVLLSGNRTRTGGDSYFCINTLCNSPDLVVLVPSAAEVKPISIVVSQENDDESSIYDIHGKTGWIRTRKKSQKMWRSRFFVLSEGILTCYEKAVPRPHGVESQVVLTDATISVKREEPNSEGRLHRGYFVVSIVTKDGTTSKERLLLFESEEKLLVWTYALECTAKAKTGAEPAPLMNAVKSVFRKRGTPKDDNNDTCSSPRAERSNLAEESLKDLVANIGLDPEVLESRLANYASKKCSTVKISVEALTEYRICTLDPQGDENEDMWATLTATFLQDFRVSGGANGRIIRGEELVQVNVLRCSTNEVESPRGEVAVLSERDQSPPSTLSRIRVPGRFPTSGDREPSPSNKPRRPSHGENVSSPSSRTRLASAGGQDTSFLYVPRMRVPGSQPQNMSVDLSPTKARSVRVAGLFRGSSEKGREDPSGRG